MNRFLIQPSKDQPGHWVCTDTENNIVCIFQEHDFNLSQRFTILNSTPPSINELPRFLREMADWLRQNHYDKIF